MTELQLSIVLGVTTGIASSMVVWYWLNRLMVPRIRLDETLPYYKLSGRPTNTQVRITNTGRRVAHSVTVRARLVLVGFIHDDNRETFHIGGWEVPFLEPGGVRRWSISLHPETSRSARTSRDFPPLIQERLDRGERVSIRSLMLHFPGSYLAVSVVATDGVSSALRAIHHHYEVGDFADGPFRGTEADGTSS